MTEQINVKSTIGEKLIVVFLETMGSLAAFCVFSICMVYLISPAYPPILFSTPLSWTIMVLLFVPLMAVLILGFRKLNKAVKVKIL